LFVGRLSPEKGARTLVAAWKRLPHIPLIVLGDGPQAHEIRSMAAGFGHISFPGAVSRDEVLEYLRRARYLVLPSEVNETFPLVMVEAFACNTPVITSPLGGPGEVIVDGRNGLLFEAGNPSDLARQAARLWSNPAHAAELGKQARLDYEARFTPERNYELLLQAYSQAIASRRMAASNGHTPG
ncbi:MAG: glycosyltransferase family 4 protein, partial [Candidatus Acidiferrales bacterium]